MMSIDLDLTQRFAEFWLGLPLSEDEAAALVQPLAGLRGLVRTLEEVPLPYTDDPFISPATGDDWLETWPDDQ
jgi:hypothetical protein